MRYYTAFLTVITISCGAQDSGSTPASQTAVDGVVPASMPVAAATGANQLPLLATAQVLKCT